MLKHYINYKFGAILNIQERGDQVCTQCGLIHNERMIDTEHLEIRAFNKEKKHRKVRTGPPIIFFKKIINMIISKKH